MSKAGKPVQAKQAGGGGPVQANSNVWFYRIDPWLMAKIVKYISAQIAILLELF